MEPAPATTIEEIEAIARTLREKALALRARQDTGETIRQIVRWRDSWFRPDSAYRKQARQIGGDFPYGMVEANLYALLMSMDESSLNALVEEEGVRDAEGYPLIGHIAAGNTPLLLWTTVLRSLLVRSASLVKLSSGDDGLWAGEFLRSLRDVCPALAACVEMRSWPGDDDALNRTLCSNVDLVVAYGSDRAIESLRAATPEGTPFVGYGHRISIGVVAEGAGAEDAQGFARDILTYDQAGCLSPQTIYVLSNTDLFSNRLALALRDAAAAIPGGTRTPQSAARVRLHRQIARMAGNRVIEGEDLRWTVVNEIGQAQDPPGGDGIVHIRPAADLAGIMQVVKEYHGRLQGCALAPWSSFSGDEPVLAQLRDAGFTLICEPGALQTPSFSWKQDGIQVLKSLTRYN